MNLAYKLKLHHKRNQYIRARLDTCTDVNIMPANVYKLAFCDPDLKKLAPSKLEIGTFTANTVKVAGSYTFFLVHPDTKWPQEVTFYVASNNSSVLLPCANTLALGLIQSCVRWNYLPTEPASLQAVLTTQRRLRHSWTYWNSKRNPQCPIDHIQYPSL